MKNQLMFVVDSHANLTTKDLHSVRGLIKELTDQETEPFTEERLIKLRDHPNNHMVFMRHPVTNVIVGMAILVIRMQFTGNKATIEDVVVTKRYRGRGLAKTMIQDLLKTARDPWYKLKYVCLTSRPERVGANKLYKKMGFKRRKTNQYQYALPFPKD